MNNLCGPAESAPAKQFARHGYEKGKVEIPGSSKPSAPTLGEGFRTQPAPAKSDEIQDFVQSKAPLPEIDIAQPLLESDHVEYNPLAQTAAAQRFNAETRALLSSEPAESSTRATIEEPNPSGPLTRLKQISRHINPDTKNTIAIAGTQFQTFMHTIASAAMPHISEYNADMESLYRAECAKQEFLYKIAVAPLREPYSDHEISKIQRLNELHKAQEPKHSRFTMFDHILTPPEGAFDASTLSAYHSELEKMSVADLEKLLTDERLINRKDSDAYEHLSSICGMTHYQLGLRGPESE